MARGWESKAIEAQQEKASQARTRRAPARVSSEVLERRQALELSRTRALADLHRATVPAHRQMLEEAIKALDEQLASLPSAADRG